MAESDEDFASLLEESLSREGQPRGKRHRPGQSVTGRIVALTDEWVFVDIGSKAEARVSRAEAEGVMSSDDLKIGARLRATVARSDGSEGTLLVVAFGRDRIDTQSLQLAADSGTPVQGTIDKAVKGGVEVTLGSVRAFCPVSQIDLAYVADPEVYVGQTHFFRVLEVRDRGRSVVVSRKALLREEQERKAEDLVSRLEVGGEVDGIVQSCQPYGVFVDLGGIQGLVHVSEMAHTRVGRPEDLVNVGDQVRVKILDIQRPASGKTKDLKLSLSMKALTQPPAAASGKADQIVEGKVARVESYGVFVDTPLGRGLIPTSELGTAPGADPRRAFPIGADLRVVAFGGDTDSGRLRFSRAAVARLEERRQFEEFASKGGAGQFGQLGDLLRGKVLDGRKR